MLGGIYIGDHLCDGLFFGIFHFFKHLNNSYQNLYVKSTLANIRRISDCYMLFLMTRLYIVQFNSFVFVMFCNE